MSAAQGSGNVSPNGERLDAPAVEVRTTEAGAVYERVRANGVMLEVCRGGWGTVDLAIGTAHGVVFIPRADLQRLLPALTLYANTGSMVAEDAAKPERHDGCNGGAL